MQQIARFPPTEDEMRENVFLSYVRRSFEIFSNFVEYEEYRTTFPSATAVNLRNLGRMRVEFETSILLQNLLLDFDSEYEMRLMRVTSMNESSSTFVRNVLWAEFTTANVTTPARAAGPTLAQNRALYKDVIASFYENWAEETSGELVAQIEHHRSSELAEMYKYYQDLAGGFAACLAFGFVVAIVLHVPLTQPVYFARCANRTFFMLVRQALRTTTAAELQRQLLLADISANEGDRQSGLAAFEESRTRMEMLSNRVGLIVYDSFVLMAVN